MGITATRAPFLWALLSTLAAALLTGCGAGFLHRETRQSQTPYLPDTPLRVVSSNGSISIRSGNQDLVLIRADIRATTPERLAAAEVTTQRLDDGTLVIGVAWPDGERKSSEGCDFLISLPGVSQVELRTTNGAIEVEGMSGQAVLTTSNGSIWAVAHNGPVAAETRNGAIRIDRPAGPVVARTSNGEVEVKDAAAGVDVETTNGAVSIALADDSPGPVRVRTSNGSVELRPGPAFRGELALGTSNGSLDIGRLRGAEVLSISSRSGKLKIGEGGDPSSVQTSNGRIRVTGGVR